MTNAIVEIQGIPCDTCNGAGFVMLHENGDTEVLKCECEGKIKEYYFFKEENR